jgi:PEP-CTERM motif
MPMIATPTTPGRAVLNRRNGAIAAVLGLGAALSIAVASDQQLSKAVANGVHDGVNSVKTVASMLAERSPGQRPKGALAKLKQLKHKRAAALPLGRHIIPPVAAILGAPAVPVILPPPIAPAPPLYNVVAGGPPIVIPPVPIPPGGGGGGGGGGPPILPGIPPPGGGGGVLIPPPIVTEVVPPPPVTSAVPEPASWAMMLLGFAMLGSFLRRQKGAGPRVASS